MLLSPVDVANHIIRSICEVLDRGRELRHFEEFSASVGVPFDQHKLAVVQTVINDHLEANAWTAAERCKKVVYQLDSSGAMKVICTV